MFGPPVVVVALVVPPFVLVVPDAPAPVFGAWVPDVLPPVPVEIGEVGAQLAAIETAIQVGRPSRMRTSPARRFMGPSKANSGNPRFLGSWRSKPSKNLRGCVL